MWVNLWDRRGIRFGPLRSVRRSDGVGGDVTSVRRGYRAGPWNQMRSGSRRNAGLSCTIDQVAVRMRTVVRLIGNLSAQVARERRPAWRRSVACDATQPGVTLVDRSVRSLPEPSSGFRQVPVQIGGKYEGTKVGTIPASHLFMSRLARDSADAVAVAASLGHLAHEDRREDVLEPPSSGPRFELLCR